ncbi:MarR family transcriptional regulator [Kribbella sp. NPDC005582]|uniref:MarR family winged helix-turn-helix transcriptional regulator n=1 Tax=Kribbella sp. NPDC005582 TaxID=3156893 RepID=UPI0033A0631A
MSQRNDRERLALAVMDLIETGQRRIARKLDLTRLRILATVADQGPLRPRELATALGLTASAVSRHLAVLEDAGEVTVTPDPADARTFLVAATKAGRRALTAATEAGTAAFVSVVAGWTDAQVAEALRGVNRLNEVWAEHHRRTDAPAPVLNRSARRRS